MDCITTERARLYCGDCFRVLEELQEREVDGVIIDPPYSSGGTFSTMRKGATYKKYCRSGSEFGKDKSFTGDNMDMRSFTLFLRELLFSARLKTKDQGVCCVFIDFRNLPAVADALQMAGWIWRGIAVWDKKSSRPQMGRFKNQCEYIVWGSNGDLPLERGVGVLDGLFSYGNVPTAKRYHQTGKPVGRCADYILQGREDCFHVFITGALPDRANRVIAEHGVAVDAARSHVKERDRKRSSYYRHITDQAWGMAANYDLCLNSSKLGIDRCVDLILGAVDMGTGHI